MSKGRKGKVFVGGHVMTTQRYMDTVVSALENNGNNWMTAQQMICWGSTNGLCEKLNSPRKSPSHPLWKILSMMSEDYERIERRKNKNGLFEYKLRKPKQIMINGEWYNFVDK